MGFGYIPVGYSAYPNAVGMLLGFASSALLVYFFCVPIISPTGRWDPITMLCCARSDELQELQSDCIKKANGETLIGSEDSAEDYDGKNLDDETCAWGFSTLTLCPHVYFILFILFSPLKKIKNSKEVNMRKIKADETMSLNDAIAFLGSTAFFGRILDPMPMRVIINVC